MTSSLTLPIREKDHIRGSLTAPVILVEYGDYQCPICRLSDPIIKQLMKDLDGKLLFIFRHFPLRQAHPYALMAAKIAEAAAEQNKFWEMHDLLFTNQLPFTPEIGLTFAEQLDLNLSQFKTDLQSAKIDQIIEEDFHTGVSSGVNGTPCFYINSKRYDGDASYDVLKRTLLEAAQNAV